MGVSIEKSKVHGWDGFVLSAGAVRLGVAPGIGGRIVSLTCMGEELLFSHPKFQGITFSIENETDLASRKRKFKETFGFPTWGGDKTWVSPQSAWQEEIPPLDLDIGRYVAEALPEAGTVRLTSPVCRETQLRLQRTITMEDSGQITLEDTLTNHGNATVTCGLWNVSQISRPARVTIPLERSAWKTQWAAPELEDWVRSRIVDRPGNWTELEINRAGEFKVGGLLREGRILVNRKLAVGGVVWERAFPIHPEAEYMHKASFELFNHPSEEHPYCEVEVHAPKSHLEPGQATSLRQSWRVYRLGSKPE